MSNLIVYKSNTGFTKSYVDMLERRVLPCEVVEISKLKKEQLKEAEYIFYGGPLKNNVIEGLDKFLKHYKLFEDKNVFIFCTGIQPIDQEKKENVITANGLEFYHVRLYLLPGGMDFSKMSPLKQKMIKGSKALIRKIINPNILSSMGDLLLLKITILVSTYLHTSTVKIIYSYINF